MYDEIKSGHGKYWKYGKPELQADQESGNSKLNHFV